jgi:predicted NBD/HSP70 family sugar kinase
VSDNGQPRRARDLRWRTASDVLAELRREPGITRAALSRRLGLSSASATEITAKLRELRLVEPTPAAPSGRGRPSTVLSPHPMGPLVVVLQIRHDDWWAGVTALDGHPRELASGAHSGHDPSPVLAALREQIAKATQRWGARVRAVSLAVAGIVGVNPAERPTRRSHLGTSPRPDRPEPPQCDGTTLNSPQERPSAGRAPLGIGQLVDASALGWPSLELPRLTTLPLFVGNDATLAGVAEARTGSAAHARVALHLLVEAGIGGTLTVDGQPLSGATGTAGEYGHLPFGDRELRCHCGALGCWERQVCADALARHLGDPQPARPRDYMLEVLTRATATRAIDPGNAESTTHTSTGSVAESAGMESAGAHSSSARSAIDHSAAALGVGIAGLVNAHDPDIVTIGGLACALRASAPETFTTAFVNGLMAFRRGHPPLVLDALHGEHGARHGAAAIGLDYLTSEPALAEWASIVQDTV